MTAPIFRWRVPERSLAVGLTCVLALVAAASVLGLSPLWSSPESALVIGGDGAPFPDGTELVVRRWPATTSSSGPPSQTRQPWDGRVPQEIELTAGARTEVYLSHPWFGTRPAALRARPGAELVVHLVPHRSIRLLHGNRARPRRVEVHVVPDRSTQPVGGAEVVDAHVGWLDGRPSWALRHDGAATYVDRLPLHPCHVFVAGGEHPVYRALSADASVVDLRTADPPLTSIWAPPRWQGRPLPPGTLVAPGRLDLRAVLELATAYRPVRAFLQPVDAPASTWTPCQVPRASWLTFFHPMLGIAYVRADAPQPWNLRPGPGAVRVRLPPGTRFTGRASLMTKWVGGGTRDVAYSGGAKSVELSLPGPLRFSGLPLGTYSVWFQGRIGPVAGAATRDGATRVAQLRRVVRLRADDPVATIDWRPDVERRGE